MNQQKLFNIIIYGAASLSLDGDSLDQTNRMNEAMLEEDDEDETMVTTDDDTQSTSSTNNELKPVLIYLDQNEKIWFTNPNTKLNNVY